MHYHNSRVALLLLCITSVYAKNLGSAIHIPSLSIREATSGPFNVSSDQIVSDTSQSLSTNENNDTAEIPHAITDLQDTGAIAEGKQQVAAKTVALTVLPPRESSVKSALEATSLTPQLHIPKNEAADEPLANPYGWEPLTLTFVQASLATVLVGYVSIYTFYSLMAWYSVLKVCRSKILKLGAVNDMVP